MFGDKNQQGAPGLFMPARDNPAAARTAGTALFMC